MIISWFTQPESGFSSYCQYDNRALQFVRVRLELGREDHNDISDTVVNYQTDRVAGFSNQDYLGETEELDPADWNVNAAGELCYQGTPLPGGRPAARDYVYDASIGATSLHAGSPVTAKPVRPEGIEPRHLALLANDAVISQTRARVLTQAGAIRSPSRSGLQAPVPPSIPRRASTRRWLAPSGPVPLSMSR